MSDEKEIFREDDEDTEMEKGSSDLDFVRERLEDESGGMEAYRQALDAVQDPQLKEILQAIQTDEQKHQAALEQWMQEHGEGEEGPEEEAAVEEEPEDLPEEEEEPLDKEDDIFPDEEEEISGDDASDLIDDIREVLAEHEAEAEPGEESLDKEDDEEDEDEDLPEFLKEDDDEEEDEDEVSKVMKSYRVPIIKTARDQQIVYGVVSEPGVEDLQGDILSESEIRKACHKFMQTSQRIGKEHSGVAKASIIESYIAPTDFKCNGQPVRKGSWIMAVKVHDKGLWQAVKKGEITGFSIAGTGSRTPL